MLGFEWIPNTNSYTYFADSGKKLMTATTADSKATELITLADLNKALSSDLKSFNGIDWKNADSFVIANGQKYYTYNTKTKTGSQIVELTESQQDGAFDNAKENLAFTDKNNLFFYNKNKEKIQVTNETNEDIVSGQFFARSEFGIVGGIFWSPKSNLLAFYQKDQSEVANYPILDISATEGKLESIKYPMIGKKSEKPRVGIYNVSTKKTVFISPKGNTDDYLTNLSWSPDEKYVLIAELNRAQNDMHLNVYDAQTGAFVRTIVDEKNSNW
ncbi:MAG TPA: DPP IV N-terminal domain-containing protein, partial [Flavobacterium sp.]|nr:DPP IV N-terminal domain-containing protein [Flavobacterium sp.]